MQEIYKYCRFDRWENIPAWRLWISFDWRCLQVNNNINNNCNYNIDNNDDDVPIVIGALGAVSHMFEKYAGKLD